LWDLQVPLEEAGLVDPESLAQGALSGIPEFKEKQDPEGFLVFLACLDLVDHLVLRVTGAYRVTLGPLEWEWRDLLDQQDLMEFLDHLELENLEHRDSEDLPENTVVVVCPAALDLSAHPATASFVKHLRCKLTEAAKRKAKQNLTDQCNFSERMNHVCQKLMTTAEVVTNVNCLLLDTRHTVVPVIFVTNIILLFISHHLCFLHPSSPCS